MTTATAERETLHRTIDTLSDEAIINLVPYVTFLKQAKLYDEDKPNAETIAAMMDAEAGIGTETTIEEIRARCNALC
ncbi:hypothetical protein AGMMS50276_27550 [Synergistales bacterium]|nr:hypothetical protein AGMMS50276_27550 [Synergistales bacterium]